MEYCGKLIKIIFFGLLLGICLPIPERKISLDDLAKNSYIPYNSEENHYLNAKKAALITSIALEQAKNYLYRAYTSEISQMNVNQFVEEIIWAEGGDSELAFPTLIYSGSDFNDAHGNPADDFLHIIDPKQEPVVMIDMGGKYHGICNDVTRTYFYENVSQQVLDAYAAVLSTYNELITAIHPGVLISDLDLIFRLYLADYINNESEYYVHKTWGHGVGMWIHEAPNLRNSTTGCLVEGMILAIEPGIMCNDGWAVRVEDTVVVTSLGVEILNSVPKSIEEMMILSNASFLTANITLQDYCYNKSTCISSSIDGQINQIKNVSFYDGYQWHRMNFSGNSTFQYSYLVDYSFSSIITGIVKVFYNDHPFYFSETFQLTPAPTNVCEVPFQVIGAKSPDRSVWWVNITSVDLIQLHFSSISPTIWDQLVLIDQWGKICFDFRDRGILYNYWSPWISGDHIQIKYVQVEQDYLDYFRFNIDKINFISSSDSSGSCEFTSTNQTNGEQQISGFSLFPVIWILIAIILYILGFPSTKKRLRFY